MHSLSSTTSSFDHIYMHQWDNDPYKGCKRGPGASLHMVHVSKKEDKGKSAARVCKLPRSSFVDIVLIGFPSCFSLFCYSKKP